MEKIRRLDALTGGRKRKKMEPQSSDLPWLSTHARKQRGKKGTFGLIQEEGSRRKGKANAWHHLALPRAVREVTNKSMKGARTYWGQKRGVNAP